MPAQTDVRFGLSHGWTLGESGWNVGMDANLLKLARVGVHLSVKDRDLATPPASPATGDTYIVAAAATGAWSGKSGQVAVWSGSTWVFYAPRLGWVTYIEDEEVLSAYKAAGWSAGVGI